MSNAGDVNADGIKDVFIGAGAYRPGNNVGRVYLASYGTLLPIPAVRNAPFALYAWEGEPGPDDVTQVPFGMGYTAMPTPLTGGRADVVWNNAHPALGVSNRPSRPAPTDVVSRMQGLGRAVTFYLQGIVFDPGSRAGVPASITNGIVVRVR